MGDLGTYNPWWKIDLNLGYPATVKQIILYNRMDCCPYRIYGGILELWTSDAINPPYLNPGNELLASRTITMNSATSQSFTFTPSLSGVKYVTVRLVGCRILSLAEVQVFGF